MIPARRWVLRTAVVEFDAVYVYIGASEKWLCVIVLSLCTAARARCFGCGFLLWPPIYCTGCR